MSYRNGQNRIGSVWRFVVISAGAVYLFINQSFWHSLEAEELSAAPISSFGAIPLYFEVNQGQVDEQVRFLSRGLGYTLFLTSTEAVLSLRRSAAGDVGAVVSDLVRLQLVDANPAAEVVGENEQVGRSNYFLSSDPLQWRTDMPHYLRVRYRQVYPGVDLVYYGTNQRCLEYDFVVAPGADSDLIRLHFEGADSLWLDEVGNLNLDTVGGKVVLKVPVTYQRIDGERQEIESRYVLQGGSQVGFELAIYDMSQPLIIDPVLSYSTYLGGSQLDSIHGISLDSSGNIYVFGNTFSSNFPTQSPFQGYVGNKDVFVAKLNASGSALIYSTYLGGSAVDESTGGIAVDGSGNAYITGITFSSDFPTLNPVQASFGGDRDVFVAKLNASGSTLAYSTYLGGSGRDESRDIAVDGSGNAYITGLTVSSNFPTQNALQPSYRGGGSSGFVSKLNASGSAVVYSTYIGGSGGGSRGNGIAVDGSGNVYITGTTSASDFPTQNPLDVSLGGSQDVFVTKLDALGSSLVYSTFLGGSGNEQGGERSITVDGSGNAYVTGSTSSTDFPTQNAFQASYGGGVFDVFVSKLNASGSALTYSTYLGGSDWDEVRAIEVDGSGDAHIIGFSRSSDFPTLNTLSAYQGGRSGMDVFVSKLNASGSTLDYSTYLGGTSDDEGKDIALDGSGNVYIAGWTKSSDFPTESPLQGTYGGGQFDGFVAKIAGIPVDVAHSAEETATPGPILSTMLVDRRSPSLRSGVRLRLRES